VKSCPSCNRLYPDDAGFCPIDGVELRSASLVPPAADASDGRIGTTLFDRYQVRRVVADGGMGRVYEALDQCDHRAVALKVLHADVARDTVALERFKREFQISQLLPHEHIVQVFDFQRTTDGSFVLVMDFLEGEELRSVLKREKTIRAERIVRMLSQLAIGLDEAHRRQLIHRDLKPDNIFLCGTREGDIVKLLDFGSVKDKSEGAKKLTVMGTTIGSPYYMSPEQAQGLETLDARADVWALAAIAYEALTGQVPFKGNNGPSILLAILTQQPVPPSQLGSKIAKSQIPPMVDDVLGESFAKNVSMRVASVGSLADKFGFAYGLTGSHRDWAYTPAQQLGERIEAALPLLIAPKPSAVAVESDPFAEPDPFKAAAPAAAMAAAPAPAAPASVQGPPMSAGALSLPYARSNNSTLLMIALAALLGVLGAAAVVLWLVLRR
jgi:serine/threonine protein kinase